MVPSVSALDNSINPDVELGEVSAGLLESSAGSGISVKVGGLTEEISTESFVRVVEDSVLVGVAKG